MDYQSAFAEYQQDALKAIRESTNASELEAVRVEFLGKKHGRLKDLQSLLGKVAAEDRPQVGKGFNAVKQAVSEALEERKQALSQPQQKIDAIDVTLPGVPVRVGHLHPLMQTIDEFKTIMARLGFSVAEGPEIEDEWHNFEALNIPDDHPARDPLDNF